MVVYEVKKNYFSLLFLFKMYCKVRRFEHTKAASYILPIHQDSLMRSGIASISRNIKSKESEKEMEKASVRKKERQRNRKVRESLIDR